MELSNKDSLIIWALLDDYEKSIKPSNLGILFNDKHTKDTDI